jgi:hypothetical protein
LQDAFSSESCNKPDGVSSCSGTDTIQDTHFEGVSSCMYATIYFGINELVIYPSFKSLVSIYFRYIDNGFGAWLIQEDEASAAANWKRFKEASTFGKLHWIISTREPSVDFLDLTIAVNYTSGIHARI